MWAMPMNKSETQADNNLSVQFLRNKIVKIKKETFKNPKFWTFFRFVVVLKPKNLKPKKNYFCQPCCVHAMQSNGYKFFISSFCSACIIA